MAGIWPFGFTFDAQRAAAAALFLGGIATLLVIAIDALQQPAPVPARVVIKIEELRPLGPDVRTVEVERGDTLTGILVEQGIDAVEARNAVAALSSVYEPTAIRAGENVIVTFAPEGSPLVSIALKPSAERDLLVRRNADGSFAVDDNVKVLTVVEAHASGTIDGSLYASVKAAGVPEAVVISLIHIYSYDVDFQREVKSGDKFDLLYTTYIDDAGQTIRGGAIAYAELTLGRTKRPLYRFTTSDTSTDYFTAKGWSGKRQLMRTPIDGARLSSKFGMRRHPILGYTKMHKGVDFAAPRGTPVMASGNGVVKMARWHGGYGNFVELTHANGYATGYGHLSRIARGIKPGAKVRQGQVIAYVGTTGRSTGPHLHYEVMLKSRQINPMGVKLPTGRELTGKDLLAFQANVARIQTVLASEPSQVAQARVLP
ncbi:MAG: peptidoglycan DD-metalloendopeptidase family protein [Alphaproteobacteria bacterium]|nr:peptidoglycan DD-metalloendopeptidase family protein [Alphaproteobacteria bacterium]